jgi:hypothetical protein
MQLRNEKPRRLRTERHERIDTNKVFALLVTFKHSERKGKVHREMRMEA